jgi:diguanylate cyclase (GGDEF)-like protein
MGSVQMKHLIAAIAVLMGCSSSLHAVAPAPLTSLRAIKALTNAEASHALPVSFTATVTYFRGYEKTMFVQDGEQAIYVQAITTLNLVPGDVVNVKGTTDDSFRPIVLSSDITLVRHGTLPKPLPATYDQLIRSERDCKLVTIRARVRAADLRASTNTFTTDLQLLMDGGTLAATVDSKDASLLPALLDSEVEITGAASGQFDGKMQQTGILIHVSGFANVKVITPGNVSNLTLRVTPMDQVLTGYHVTVHSQRLRVHGTITYYQPGSAIVLQNGPRSLWIQTHSASPQTIGDEADVTGFPGLHDGFLTLTNGAITDAHIRAPITPQSANWLQLVSSGNVFDLVSIEGEVVAALRETAQDEFVLKADGHVFSAIYRHPPPSALSPTALPPIRPLEAGTKVRVTGICTLDDANPFDQQVPFTILMRSQDDIAVLAGPPLLSIQNLTLLVGLLIAFVFILALWGWASDFKMRRQNASAAYIERRRGRVLEDISGSRPLAEILEQITELVSFRLKGSPCWCQVADGALLGNCPAKLLNMRVIEKDIPARSGAPLGKLYAAFDPRTKPGVAEEEAMSMAASLATLAIETRGLYTDLLHRSEYDQLTSAHNRFSLEKRLDAQIELARQSAGIFGLIYIDLDQFKQINDLYGHKIGDRYLQEVAMRMKCQLRSVDTLARIGGDEFAVLVPIVRNRADVEDIAQRLERCFQKPFVVEEMTLQGFASLGTALYPEDGKTRDSLLHTADTAMYSLKHGRRQAASLASGSYR